SPPGPVRVGSTYHYATETRGKRTESTMQVTWFEPDRFWVIETTHLPSPIETSFLFEPVTGGTRLTVQTHLPGIAPTIAREMVRKQTETTLREQLQRIREQLQPGSGAEGAA
ncbi:MAG: SRPBCC domain-containing protein, partial [Anaerolineae bacterium]|nr:SRPBCC domain-containing protein [Anaerolineae bacterium]